MGGLKAVESTHVQMREKRSDGEDLPASNIGPAVGDGVTTLVRPSVPSGKTNVEANRHVDARTVTM
jgi:hypothetical protein